MAVVRAPGTADSRVRWAAFGAISFAYLAVTIGESVLAPAFPLIADDFDLPDGAAGVSFGILTGSIAVANIGGGFLLARRGGRTGILVALAATAAGAAIAATAGGIAVFLAAQVLLGLGAGLFFAPGIHAIGVIAGAQRRGLAMGLFGVAFSAGLSAAALLGVLGDRTGWRVAFVVAGLVALSGLVAVLATDLPPRRSGPAGGVRLPLRAALGTAAGVGSAAACAQYGTVSYLPIFAVAAWDLSPGAAALVLACGRVLSVPAKTLAGHDADRRGAVATVRLLGAVLAASGVVWVLAPVSEIAVVAAIAFTATTSAVFPVANLLALSEFGDRGPLLGTYRSVQMGVGAAMTALIGLGAATIGLRPTLAATIAVPASLTLVGRR